LVGREPFAEQQYRQRNADERFEVAERGRVTGLQGRHSVATEYEREGRAAGAEI